MWWLEGTVNGCPVHEEGMSVGMVLLAAESLLTMIEGKHLMLILGTLYSALTDGRSWCWVGEEFTLMSGSAPI